MRSRDLPRADSTQRETLTDPRPLTPWQLRRAWLSGGFGLGISIMVNFLVPLRAVELGASLAIVGVIVGAGSIVPAVMGAPIGALADRVGARRMFQIATAGAALATAAMALARHWSVLLGLMVVFGLFRTSGWVSSQSYITSIGNPDDRTVNTSRFSFTTAASRAANPLLIGVAAQVVGFRWSFLVVAGYAALYFSIAAGLAEPDRPQQTGDQVTTGGLRAAMTLVRRPGIQVALLLSFARVWAAAVMVAFYPLLLVERGISSAVAGSVVSLTAGVGMIVTLLVPRLLQAMSKEMLTAAGLMVGAIGFALVPVTTTTAAAYIPAAMVGIGEGLSLPTLIAIIGEAAGPQLRGLAIGIRSSVNQLAQFSAATVIGTLVATIGLAAGFPVAGGATAVVTLAATKRHLTERRRRTAPAHSRPAS